MGALPGLGGPIITWIAYGHLVQTTRDRAQLGKGDIRGVIAPESANNADNGGALVPALMFGIPGSASMALFLGGLILLGVEPGIGMMERHLDLTFVIIWSLALANVLGTATCLFLAKPIARLTLVPFAVLAPFMIVIVYFAAYQTTRAWEDLIALFVLGVLGCYMKRFGWSPPALLIGFVLAQRLDAAVYQSIQVYGMSFLERGGVQVILALTVVSIVLGVRLNPHREPLTGQGPHAPHGRAPQAAFLALLTAAVLYAMYDMSHMAFLGIVFPMAVGLITLALMIGIAVVFLRKRPSYALYDKEHAPAGEAKPPYSELHVQAWILALLAAIAALGFILGVFLYIAVFLRVKAQVKPSSAILSALGAVALFAVLGHLLVLHYPEGLLQHWLDLPWPLE